MGSIVYDYASINQILRRIAKDDKIEMPKAIVREDILTIAKAPQIKPTVVCTMCGGNGWVYMQQPTGTNKRVTCGPCQGRGYIP